MYQRRRYVHVGDAYMEDNREVWGLLSQYCSTNNEAKAITNRHKISKNGRTTWKELVLHFESASYKANCVTEGNKLMSQSQWRPIQLYLPNILHKDE